MERIGISNGGGDESDDEERRVSRMKRGEEEQEEDGRRRFRIVSLERDCTAAAHIKPMSRAL